MLPEAGAFELIFLAAVALIVVGPKDLPVLLRKVGQFTAKMRGLAAEFRSSFDEMARQSELDELRKEVDALRQGVTASNGAADVESHFREIGDHLTGRADASAYHSPWEDASVQAAAAAPLSVTADGDETPELPFPDAPHPAQTAPAPADAKA